ncbi:MAG: GNAT family N-acetyltransferase [Pseudomonadota bacterium]
MHIREGARSDLESVASIHAASWRDSYRGIMEDGFLDGPVVEDRLDAWRRRLDAPPNPAVLLIAEEDADVLGFVYVCPDDDSDRLLLDNLHVSAASRGRGIGLALMQQMGRALRNLGHTRVRLLVLEGNDGACRFYDRLGGQRQQIVHKGLRGLGPFASIPFTWDDFPGVMADAVGTP